MLKRQFNRRQGGNAKSAERQKKGFPKEMVENTDLDKTVLNKT